MVVHLDGPLGFTFGIGAHPVLVVLSSAAAKEVISLFKVVCFQVICKARNHVSSITSRSHTGEHHVTSPNMKLASCKPHRANNEDEIGQTESVTLTRVLNLNGVQMKMELGGKVRVKHCVDIFHVCSAGILVQRIGFRVGTVETTTTGSNKGTRLLDRQSTAHK